MKNSESTRSVTVIDENILQIFIPMKIKRRGGSAMLILSENDSNIKSFDDKLLKAFALSYKWKVTLEDENNKINSLSELARSENISMSHVTKVYRLNFISPRIIEAIVNGTAPRTLRLQDIFAKKAPHIWQEQEELWEF